MSQPPAHPPLYLEISVPALDHDRNLALILTRQSGFEPSKVRRIFRLRRRRVQANDHRNSMTLENDLDIAAIAATVESHLLPRAGSIAQALGAEPFRIGKTTSSCTCFRHGAFFRRHFDRFPEHGGLRRLSWVYYLNSEPRRFAGGTLRLFGKDDAQAMVEPEHGKIVVFLSGTPHEVSPVELVPDDFARARFTVTGFISDRASFRDRLRYYGQLARHVLRRRKARRLRTRGDMLS